MHAKTAIAKLNCKIEVSSSNKSSICILEITSGDGLCFTCTWLGSFSTDDVLDSGNLLIVASDELGPLFTFLLATLPLHKAQNVQSITIKNK